MKKIFLGLFVILSTLPFLNCEPDDVCPQGTPTTPRMIVQFFDNNNPTNPKTITDLKVTAEGMSSSLDFASSNKIELPLKVNNNQVRYTFQINSKNSTLAKEDQITLNYSRNDVYISRACGYKTEFTLNTLNGATLTTPKNWIQEVTIQKTSIVNENETHLKIFF
ncbi:MULTISPECIES: DUF6452 family protein [Flavobacterium]|uniref:Lipoprotein n=2 Tax=Flavobacterium TaxID=237 RepID=A0AA94F1Y5_9FLAO|nr:MULTISPECIES: DUF6452 family protein [Flavobacterium]OXA75102.1 hypothetical protein B0A56_11600 [Flavobacterium columnare NBRC 100251 = ATCC 23463]AMA48545.1 hypothetical protein AWN65_03265 [Flavobacterium covae]AND65327.1 hypothetical protein AX766_13495 [Flavobacterium covae]MCH4830495.1 hypothetical protein [Flavobacterium columnare]MCH4833568.1 hypothetical protein [Flavobacterium columnare]